MPNVIDSNKQDNNPIKQAMGCGSWNMCWNCEIASKNIDKKGRTLLYHHVIRCITCQDFFRGNGWPVPGVDTFIDLNMLTRIITDKERPSQTRSPSAAHSTTIATTATEKVSGVTRREQPRRRSRPRSPLSSPSSTRALKRLRKKGTSLVILSLDERDSPVRSQSAPQERTVDEGGLERTQISTEADAAHGLMKLSRHNLGQSGDSAEPVSLAQYASQIVHENAATVHVPPGSGFRVTLSPGAPRSELIGKFLDQYATASSVDGRILETSSSAVDAIRNLFDGKYETHPVSEAHDTSVTASSGAPLPETRETQQQEPDAPSRTFPLTSPAAFDPRTSIGDPVVRVNPVTGHKQQYGPVSTTQATIPKSSSSSLVGQERHAGSPHTRSFSQQWRESTESRYGQRMSGHPPYPQQFTPLNAPTQQSAATSCAPPTLFPWSGPVPVPETQHSMMTSHQTSPGLQNFGPHPSHSNRLPPSTGPFPGQVSSMYHQTGLAPFSNNPPRMSGVDPGAGFRPQPARNFQPRTVSQNVATPTPTPTTNTSLNPPHGREAKAGQRVPPRSKRAACDQSSS